MAIPELQNNYDGTKFLVQAHTLVHKIVYEIILQHLIYQYNFKKISSSLVMLATHILMYCSLLNIFSFKEIRAFYIMNQLLSDN